MTVSVSVRARVQLCTWYRKLSVTSRIDTPLLLDLTLVTFGRKTKQYMS